LPGGDIAEGVESIGDGDRDGGDGTVECVVSVSRSESAGIGDEGEWIDEDFASDAEQLFSRCSSNVRRFAQDF